MVETLDFTAELGSPISFSAALITAPAQASTVDPTISAENHFFPHNGEIVIADDYAGLATASPAKLRSFSFTISKNLERDHIIGKIGPDDILNRDFVVEGSLERDFLDNSLLIPASGSLYKAIRVTFENSAVNLDGGYHPTLTFEFPKVKFTDRTEGTGLGDIVTESLSFKAFYDQGGQNFMIKGKLRNTQSSY